MTPEPEEETHELHEAQSQRESEERAYAREATTSEDVEAHERRADKAAYLKRKLEERAESEAES